jgi:hypothetical protein
VEHFYYIAAAMNQPGQDGMWDDQDGFYYDLLRLPDGRATRLKVRSMVGLLPLCATTVIEKWQRERVPHATSGFQARMQQMPELVKSIHPTGAGHLGVAERGILVDYLPAESNSGMFGGNSNWRGPVWLPVNLLIIRALLQFYLYYGDTFKIECPVGSGTMLNLFDVAREIAQRLTRIFLRDERGRRAVYGGTEKFQSDPHWRDHLLFYEYFHADNGAGLGASHQTGWTGTVAMLIHLFGFLDPQRFLEGGKEAAFAGPRGRSVGRA